MNRTDLKNICKGLIVGLVLAVGVGVLGAWSEPTTAPPSGNPEAPINVSNSGQSKGGNLLVNANNQFLNGFLVPFGNVVIGDSSPEAGLKLDVEGKTGATQFCNENGTKCFTVDKLCTKISGLCI